MSVNASVPLNILDLLDRRIECRGHCLVHQLGFVALDKKPVDLPCQTASTIDHLSVGLFCVERSLGADVDVRFDDVLLTVP